MFEENHTTAANWGEVVLLTASDGTQWDLFGFSVAISGNFAVVGASWSGPGTTHGPGAAYVFNRGSTNSWSQVKKLEALDGSNGDNFGFAVSISGPIVVVAANHHGAKGAYYIYGHDVGGVGNWGPSIEHVPADTVSNFAASLCINKSTVAVGGGVDLNLSNLFAGYSYVVDYSVTPYSNPSTWEPIRSLLQ